MTELVMDVGETENSEKKLNQEDIRLGGSSPMITIFFIINRSFNFFNFQ